MIVRKVDWAVVEWLRNIDETRATCSKAVQGRRRQMFSACGVCQAYPDNSQDWSYFKTRSESKSALSQNQASLAVDHTRCLYLLEIATGLQPNLMPDTCLLHAYRHLYRNALLATHRSSPAKHVIREIIRTAFRMEDARNFNLRRVKNTEEFLKRAKQDTGIEHRILKNLLHVRYWQHHAKRDNRLQVW